MELILLVALFLFYYGNGQVRKYEGYKVFRVTPTTDEQKDFLEKIEREMKDFDFWKSSSYRNVSVDIMVPPHKKGHFSDITKHLGLEIEIYIENVQSLIDETSNPRKFKSGSFNFTSYNRLGDINKWLDSLATKYSNVQIVTSGKSYEKRDIKGVKLSFGEGKNAIFLEGGIHSREWISTATVLYILNQFVINEDPEVRAVVRMYDWYIFPVVNPDGYEYTFEYDRFWRKTRKPYGECFGADPNRNWDFEWMAFGASPKPCDQSYGGPTAFSEIETKSLSEYITNISGKLVGYISFHSYGQLLLIPYGHSPDHVENYDELFEIGQKAAEKLAEKYGTKYHVGNTAEAIYLASGGSVDWVKGTFATPITYAFELRDQGKYGFLLPASQIIPTGEETMDSLIEIVKEMENRGY